MLDVTQSSSLAANRAGKRAVAEDAPAPRRGEFTKGKIAAYFVVLMAIVSIPILMYPLPPISDYINHLARMHVIATGSSDPDLSRYYEIDWQVIPNLMMDLIVPMLERVMNVYRAGQAYTLLSFLLILSGTVALHRQLFGRWSAVPLIAFPLLYNRVFLVGTMNYVFGIGLLLWALVVWVALRERNAALRLSVSLVFALGLFFCHLFALGVYALGLLAFETRRLWLGYTGVRRASGSVAARQALPRLILDFVITGLPFLPVLLLLMMSPTRALWNFDWQLDGKITVYCGGVGTGGMLTGVSKALRAAGCSARIIALEPDSSPFLTTGKAGAHRVEGIASGRRPPHLEDTSVYDEARAVSEEGALELSAAKPAQVLLFDLN